MAFEAVDASGGGGMFPQHPKSGDWETLKGRMLSPMLAMPMESTASGDSRHQAPAGGPGWDEKILVTTPLTHGGGAMAK